MHKFFIFLPSHYLNCFPKRHFAFQSIPELVGKLEIILQNCFRSSKLLEIAAARVVQYYICNLFSSQQFAVHIERKVHLDNEKQMQRSNGCVQYRPHYRLHLESLHLHARPHVAPLQSVHDEHASMSHIWTKQCGCGMMLCICSELAPLSVVTLLSAFSIGLKRVFFRADCINANANGAGLPHLSHRGKPVPVARHSSTRFTWNFVRTQIGSVEALLSPVVLAAPVHTITPMWSHITMLSHGCRHVDEYSQRLVCRCCSQAGIQICATSASPAVSGLIAPCWRAAHGGAQLESESQQMGLSRSNFRVKFGQVRVTTKTNCQQEFLRFWGVNGHLWHGRCVHSSFGMFLGIQFVQCGGERVGIAYERKVVKTRPT